MKIYLTVLFTFFISTTTTAQIVNIEAKRDKITLDTTGWFGKVDLGLNLTENGKTIINLSANADIEHQNGKNLWLSFTNYNLLRAEGSDFVNTGFQHLRYNRFINEKLSWEAFGQVQYNERLRIKFRGLLGTGPRFRLLSKPSGSLYLGSLYMYQYEETNDGAIIHQDHRISAYLSYRIKFTDSFSFSGTSYYQPLLGDLSIMRISSQSTFIFKISKKLAFKSAFNFSFDNRLSRETEDIPTTVYNLTNGLRWTF